MKQIPDIIMNSDLMSFGIENKVVVYNELLYK